MGVKVGLRSNNPKTRMSQLGSIATGLAETTCLPMSAFHPMPTVNSRLEICREVPIGDIQQTKCDGVKELDIRNRGKRVWTQIGWGRSHLIGQPHSLQSACPLGGILLSAKR